MKSQSLLPLLLLPVVPLALSAQDLDRVMPEPVPKLVEPVEEAPAALPPQLAEEILAGDLEAIMSALLPGPDEEIVVEELAGIRVVGTPEAVDPSWATAEDPVVVEVGDPLTRDSMLVLLSLFQGAPASAESIERMVLSLRLILAQLGYPFSIVYVPPQDITDGFLHLVVVESRLGRIAVEGNRHFSDWNYLFRIPLRPGDPIDAEALRTGLDRINANPFRDAAARFAKGAEPGTADLVLQARDRFPVRIFGGYNNTGTETTSEDRILAGLNWGNAFGLGHLATVQWTSDPEFKYSRALSGNYVADLPGNQSVTLFGAYSTIEGRTAAEFDQEGESWQVGANYDIPLPSANPAFQHRLQFGADFKSSDNNLDFLSPPFIFPVVDNLTQVIQGRVQYRASLRDRHGVTHGGLKLTGSPGNLSPHNDDEAFGAARAFAKAEYLYANLDLHRDTALPGGWRWVVRSELQLSTANLLGSEAFSGGGAYSVRGYEEGVVLGDNAWLLSTEIHLPVLHPAGQLGGGFRDALDLFVFTDYATLRSVDELPGESPTDLWSAGAGLNYQFSHYGTLTLAYGWQLRDPGPNATETNGRASISLMLEY